VTPAAVYRHFEAAKEPDREGALQGLRYLCRTDGGGFQFRPTLGVKGFEADSRLPPSAFARDYPRPLHRNVRKRISVNRTTDPGPLQRRVPVGCLNRARAILSQHIPIEKTPARGHVFGPIIWALSHGWLNFFAPQTLRIVASPFSGR